MKIKTILFFFIFLTFAYTIKAQDIIIDGDVNTEKYPEISFSINYYHPDEKKSDVFKLTENGAERKLTVVSKKNTVDSLKDKVILVLFENMAHSSYTANKSLYQNILEGTLPNFVNAGDKINVVTFDRDHGDGSNILKPILDEYTDDVDLLTKKINEIQTQTNSWSSAKGSDLYLAIDEGLKQLNKKYPNKNTFLLVFSGGYNNEASNNNSTEPLKDLSKKYKTPIYMMQTQTWEHRSLATLCENTYGKHHIIKEVSQAQDTLNNFMQNAVTRRMGFKYIISFKTEEKNDSKQHSFELYVEKSEVVKGTYTVVCTDFYCWITQNYILLIIIIFVVVSLIAALIFVNKKNKLRQSKIIEEQEKDRERQAEDDRRRQRTESKKQEEEKLWLQSETENTLEAYKGYISQYSEGLYVAKAKNKINEIEKNIAEDNEWKNIKQKDSITVYESYIRNGGKYKSEALVEIKRLQNLEIAEKDNELKLMKEMKFLGQLPRIIYEINGKFYNCEINKPKVFFGRGQENNYQIDSQFLSNQHFLIFFENRNYYIKDLKSTNKTYLNGDQITGTALLNDRDVIIAGPVKFTFQR